MMFSCPKIRVGKNAHASKPTTSKFHQEEKGEENEDTGTCLWCTKTHLFCLRNPFGSNSC
uniref:Uncharacterized protein n=1 Tax=Rhizophora mucronata TaxID=61149 RepID=A0A2P2P5G5_RHIMU